MNIMDVKTMRKREGSYGMKCRTETCANGGCKTKG